MGESAAAASMPTPKPTPQPGSGRLVKEQDLHLTGGPAPSGEGPAPPCAAGSSLSGGAACLRDCNVHNDIVRFDSSVECSSCKNGVAVYRECKCKKYEGCSVNSRRRNEPFYISYDFNATEKTVWNTEREQHEPVEQDVAKTMKSMEQAWNSYLKKRSERFNLYMTENDSNEQGGGGSKGMVSYARGLLGSGAGNDFVVDDEKAALSGAQMGSLFLETGETAGTRSGNRTPKEAPPTPTTCADDVTKCVDFSLDSTDCTFASFNQLDALMKMGGTYKDFNDYVQNLAPKYGINVSAFKTMRGRNNWGAPVSTILPGGRKRMLLTMSLPPWNGEMRENYFVNPNHAPNVAFVTMRFHGKTTSSVNAYGAMQVVLCKDGSVRGTTSAQTSNNARVRNLTNAGPNADTDGIFRAAIGYARFQLALQWQQIGAANKRSKTGPCSVAEWNGVECMNSIFAQTPKAQCHFVDFLSVSPKGGSCDDEADKSASDKARYFNNTLRGDGAPCRDGMNSIRLVTDKHAWTKWYPGKVKLKDGDTEYFRLPLEPQTDVLSTIYGRIQPRHLGAFDCNDGQQYAGKCTVKVCDDKLRIFVPATLDVKISWKSPSTGRSITIDTKVTDKGPTAARRKNGQNNKRFQNKEWLQIDWSTGEKITLLHSFCRSNRRSQPGGTKWINRNWNSGYVCTKNHKIRDFWNAEDCTHTGEPVANPAQC